MFPSYMSEYVLSKEEVGRLILSKPPPQVLRKY